MSSDFEYIIVGSGVAATLVTQTLLSANPSASILILEAGKRIKARDRAYWWDIALNDRRPYSWTYDNEKVEESFSVGATDWGFKESRVRAFGGSTMHWGGWSLRYKEEDFECRSRTGRGADWPFGYDELEPWYTKAEIELSVSGNHNDDGPERSGEYPMPVFPWSAHEAELAESFSSNGLVPGHMPIARFHRCMTTGTCKYCPIGSRYTAQDSLERLESNPIYTGLHIKTGAPVIELIAEKSKVIGARYCDPDTKEPRSAHAQKVIVCAGAYESPKLLMRSTSDVWPNGVGNNHDQVGRYIVTHTMLIVRGSLPTNPNRWFQEYDFPTLMSRSWDTPERQCEGKVFLFNSRSKPHTDLAQEMIAGRTREQVESTLTGPRRAGLDAFIEEFGEFENRILLGKGDGNFNLPKTVVEFSRSADLAKTAEKVRSDMSKILTSLGHTVIKTETRNPRGDHTSGTCRMGTTPDNSVTDKHLRVHGVENLYICSNAVFPSAAAVNPTLTLAALSLRLGDHLTSFGGGKVAS